MAKEDPEEKRKWHKVRNVHQGGGSAVYGLGLIGALVYFLQHASSFSDGLFGIIKAILWPAFLIYKVLEILKI